MKFLKVPSCLLAVLFWVGCAGHVAPVRPPVAKPTVSSPVEGIWENTGRTSTRKMVFEPGGRLTFQGGLEFFNPGQWDFDPVRHELRITLPQADVDKLQIFQMYVGNGVKAFHPAQKEIVYSFDSDTSALNIGGWTYSKAGTDAVRQSPPEPVLK